MGMFDFLTGRTKKTNLVPEIQQPIPGNQFFTGVDASRGNYNLRDLAKRRLQGQDLGLGDDFVDKMVSPAAASLEAGFQNKTLPRLSSEASKRGISRSSIITDQIGQAESEKNRDVSNLVAQFDYLNRMQKKTDMTEGINLAANLNREEVGMDSERAAASERQVTRNIAGDQYQDANKAAAGGRILQAAGAAVGGPIGGAIAGSFGGGNMGGLSTADLFTQLYSGQSGVQTQTLGGGGIEDLIRKIFGGGKKPYNLGLNPSTMGTGFNSSTMSNPPR